MKQKVEFTLKRGGEPKNWPEEEPIFEDSFRKRKERI